MGVQVSRYSGEDKPVRIPLPEMVETAFGVYFRAGATGPPEGAALKGIVSEWLTGHAEEPLQGDLRAWVERDILSLTVSEKDDLPAPPLDLLQGWGLGEREEQRFI